jgi:PilZ domain
VSAPADRENDRDVSDLTKWPARAPEARGMTNRRIRTSILAEFEAGELRGRGKIRNVAEGGLFVGTALVPDQGELVSLSFRDHRGRALDVHGLVWWTTAEEPGAHRTPGFGMRLLEESEQYNHFIESLVG